MTRWKWCTIAYSSLSASRCQPLIFPSPLFLQREHDDNDTDLAFLAVFAYTSRACFNSFTSSSAHPSHLTVFTAFHSTCLRLCTPSCILRRRRRVSRKKIEWKKLSVIKENYCGGCQYSAIDNAYTYCMNEIVTRLLCIREIWFSISESIHGFTWGNRNQRSLLSSPHTTIGIRGIAARTWTLPRDESKIEKKMKKKASTESSLTKYFSQR